MYLVDAKLDLRNNPRENPQKTVRLLTCPVRIVPSEPGFNAGRKYDLGSCCQRPSSLGLRFLFGEQQGGRAKAEPPTQALLLEGLRGILSTLLSLPCPQDSLWRAQCRVPVWRGQGSIWVATCCSNAAVFWGVTGHFPTGPWLSMNFTSKSGFAWCQCLTYRHVVGSHALASNFGPTQALEHLGTSWNMQMPMQVKCTSGSSSWSIPGKSFCGPLRLSKSCKHLGLGYFHGLWWNRWDGAVQSQRMSREASRD